MGFIEIFEIRDLGDFLRFFGIYEIFWDFLGFFEIFRDFLGFFGKVYEIFSSDLPLYFYDRHVSYALYYPMKTFRLVLLNNFVQTLNYII